MGQNINIVSNLMMIFNVDLPIIYTSFGSTNEFALASAGSAPRIHSGLTATSSHVNNPLHADHQVAIETPVMIERAS